MAQLRQDHESFVERGAVVVVVGPEDRDAFERYWASENLPFVGLADPDHTVSRSYGQSVKLLRLGRLPALVVIDRDRSISYRHYGDSIRDYASNADVLAHLDQLNAEADARR